MLQKLNVAIVGLGTAGPTAALYLQRAGHQVTLFERVPEPQAVGSGLLLQPTGQSVLAELGLWARAQELGSPVRRLHGQNARGRLLMDMDYHHLDPTRQGLGILRGSLFDLLYGAVRQADIAVQTGVTISCVQTDADGSATLHADDGRQFGPYGLVLICSGSKSHFEHPLERQRRVRPYPWGALYATCVDTKNQFSGVLQQRYAGAEVMIGVLPCGRYAEDAPGTQRVSLFWSLPVAAYAQWQATGLAAWKTQVLGHWPQLAALLEQIDSPAQLALATYNDTVMPRCADGPLVYLGDAAHAMSPQLGQGANLALLDARALSAALQQYDTLPAALQTYQRSRRQHQRYYQFCSRWLTPFYQSHSRALAWVRDTFLPPVYYLPYARRAILETLSGYRGGVFSSMPELCAMRLQSVQQDRP